MTTIKKDDFNWVDLGIRRNGMKVLFADRNVGAEQPHDFGTHSTWDEAMQITFDSKEVQIPEEEDLNLLIEMNDVEFIHNYNDTGKNGLLITGRNEFAKNSIFLPAAGYCDDSSLHDAGDYGDYWSRSLDDDLDIPLYLYFGNGDWWTDFNSRCFGHSVRPIMVIPEDD